jgi:TRAP-type C4-dicarboxylate transport system substrate-binding protein
LSEQEQIWLQEAADESAIHQRILWAESEAYSLEQAEAAGVEILYPDKEPFIERVQGLYEEFKKDEQLQRFIERIQEKENPVSQLQN